MKIEINCTVCNHRNATYSNRVNLDDMIKLTKQFNTCPDCMGKCEVYAVDEKNTFCAHNLDELTSKEAEIDLKSSRWSSEYFDLGLYLFWYKHYSLDEYYSMELEQAFDCREIMGYDCPLQDALTWFEEIESYIAKMENVKKEYYNILKKMFNEGIKNINEELEEKRIYTLTQLKEKGIL